MPADKILAANSHNRGLVNKVETTTAAPGHAGSTAWSVSQSTAENTASGPDSGQNRALPEADPLQNAAHAALDAITSPEFSPEARARRIVEEILTMNYPNDQRREVAAGELRDTLKHIPGLRAQGDWPTILKELTKTHTRCRTVHAVPIPVKTAEDHIRTIWTQLNDSGWPSREIEYLVTMMKHTGENVVAVGRHEVEVASPGGARRRVTRQMVQDFAMPLGAVPEIWKKGFSQSTFPEGPLSHPRNE